MRCLQGCQVWMAVGLSLLAIHTASTQFFPGNNLNRMNLRQPWMGPGGVPTPMPNQNIGRVTLQARTPVFYPTYTQQGRPAYSPGYYRSNLRGGLQQINRMQYGLGVPSFTPGWGRMNLR